MFQSYVLAYFRENPRLRPEDLARGIALFSLLRKRLPRDKIYPLLSGAINCLVSPARYPDIVINSQGVLYQATSLDHIKGWEYNKTIPNDVSKIAESVFLVLVISHEKYQGLDAEWFAQACVAMAEKIKKKVTVDNEYWHIYLELRDYVRRLQDLSNRPIFVDNLIRHLKDLATAAHAGPDLVLQYAASPSALEDAPEADLGEAQAHGSFGSVYVIESSEGDKLAVKKQVLSDMINQELTIMASSNHPNIIDLYSFKLSARMCYIYMPYGEVLSTYTAKTLSKENWDYVYVQGKSMAKLAKKLRRSYARDILAGLQYLHEKGILHGDIKPANVVIVDGVAKLIDFGLSVMYTFSKFDPQIKKLDVYSLPYRPPEINYLQDRSYSFSAEVWAAGVTLLELETGVLPTIYGDIETMTREENLLRTTVDVIGPPFEIPPYDYFPFRGPGVGGLEAVEDIKFRELILSMLEWLALDRATIPDLLAVLDHH